MATVETGDELISSFNLIHEKMKYIMPINDLLESLICRYDDVLPYIEKGKIKYSPTSSGGGFSIYVDRDATLRQSSYHADELIKSNFYSSGGIYFDLNTLTSMLRGDRPHLYPWVGIIEYCDLNMVQDMFSRANYISSHDHCLGFITFNHIFADKIREIAFTYDLRATVSAAKILTMPSSFFNLTQYMEHPHILNYNSKTCINMDTGVRTNLNEDEINMFISERRGPILIREFIEVFGFLSRCISGRIPIITKRTLQAQFTLGRDYPLFVANTNIPNLRNKINCSVLEEASRYMENIDMKNGLYLHDWIESLKNSSVGRRVICVS